MSFSRWLRTNAEHYLLIDAQSSVARGHGARAPRSPHGFQEVFWLRVFAPVYRALPWSLRHRIMLLMPGSHRQQWAPPPRRPAPVSLHVPSTTIHQEKESAHGTDRG